MTDVWGFCHDCGVRSQGEKTVCNCGSKNVRHTDIGWLKEEVPEKEKSPEQERENARS